MRKVEFANESILYFIMLKKIICLRYNSKNCTQKNILEKINLTLMCEKKISACLKPVLYLIHFLHELMIL